MRALQVGLVVGAALLCDPSVTRAHFKLLEPASWLVSNDRGDPQKAAPCGGDAKDKGTPSNIVGKAVGGQKLRIRVLETIYHPGHYRVALAVNSRDELPPDPVTTTRQTEKGPRSVWAVVQSSGATSSASSHGFGRSPLGMGFVASFMDATMRSGARRVSPLSDGRRGG